MRLAEGAFRYGPEENLYLLVLLKEVDGKFKAVASVPRICVRDAGEESRHGSA
ncbi:hypothetical protein FA13DRAFT_1743186 [Coprinellus micaceus]|uniref:Uncharacterized protein n=1 Tax=Coprinellus micaceus TaxID=71717 RepID=A0A4Y7SFN4_COPMI|nr:hypothetical protein FA13DRAFT_1743186 [Coprinellus micaceus]